MTSGPQTGSEGGPEVVDIPDAPSAPGPDGDAGDARPDEAPVRADGPDAGPGAGEDGAPGGPGADGPVDESAQAPAADGAASGDDSDAPADAEPGPEERLVAAEALAEEHWNGRLRLQAELENQRKRALRDVQNARKFGLEPLMNDLLPVLDSLEMGLQAGAAENATVQSLREGSELTLKMFGSMLDKHGVAELDPVGERFDPEFHQAMSMQAVEGAEPNTVVQVLQKGYTLNERLLRPALVMVAK